MISPELFLPFLFFIFGISLGSFLNVFIDRSFSKESIIFGKSHCDSCKKNIRYYDLAPLFSFLFLRAKCRHCKHPISFYYPLVELVTGFLFVVAYIFFPIQAGLWTLVYYLFILSCLIIVFFADLKYGIIPDKIVFPAILVSFLFLILNSEFLISHILSALGAFIFFLILSLATGGKGMGEGDIKFSFLMGLVLGFPKIIVALYLAFLTGAIVGVILILCRVLKFRGSTIPFGPFLVIGAILALFYSEFFIDLLLFRLF